MTLKDEVIFWFNIPPKVEKGAFNYLSEHWPAKVYYVILNDLAPYRKQNGWDDGDFGNAEVIRLWEKEDVDAQIRQICESHPSAIHIINGFTNVIQRKVRQALRGKNARIGVYTERPSYLGGSFRFLRTILLYLKYTCIRIRDNKTTDFVLPLGEKGTRVFSSFGWEKDKLFHFMYNPIIEFPEPIKKQPSSPVRFVYVGRFQNKTKGIDLLIKACDCLSGSWTMDFVGGYGVDANKTIAWIDSKQNAHYLGSWKSQQVVANLRNYDVVVVPSRSDGWNLLVNEAIAAGVGCVVSDEAVSHELILASGAGMVYHWNRPKELAEYMQRIIDNPELVRNWKDRAVEYRPRIGTDTVGRYLMAVLDYVYYREDGQSRPECPWV